MSTDIIRIRTKSEYIDFLKFLDDPNVHIINQLDTEDGVKYSVNTNETIIVPKRLLPKTKTVKKDYTIVLTKEDRKDLIDHIQKHEILAFDIEATGLNVRRDQTIGFSVSGEEGKGFYYPIKTYSTEHGLIKKENYDHMISMLNLLIDKKLITWNGSYDLRFIKREFGIDLVPSLWIDAQLLKHTLEEEGSFALKEVAVNIQKYIGLDVEKAANEEQIKLKENVAANGGSTTKDNYEMYKADLEVMGPYAAADADLTLRVANYYLKKLKEEGLEKLFFEDEVMPLYKEVTIPMEENGVKLDMPLILKAKEEIESDIAMLEKKVVEELFKMPEVNEWYHEVLDAKVKVSPGGAFGQKLADRFGLDLPKSPTGKCKLSKTVVQKLPDSPVKSFLLKESNELDPVVVKSIQDEIYQEANGGKINLASKKQLSEIFFNKLGEKPLGKTPKGAPQFNDEVVELLKDKYEFAKQLHNYNKLNKVQSSYINRYIDGQEDGHYYFSYKQFGTISGRYGSDAQQMPRPLEPGQEDDIVIKYVNQVRAFFIAGKGRKFVDSDYCLHPETELLTKRRGWVKVLNLTEEDIVWQVDPESLKGSWCKPSRLIKRHYDGTMYTFGNRRGSFTVTKNHTMLWAGQYHISRKDKELFRKTTLSQEGVENYNQSILVGSTSSGITSDFTKEEIWKACMFQADGSINKKAKTFTSYTIQVSKPEKRKKVKELLKRPGIIAELRDCHNLKTETWHGNRFETRLLNKKFLNAELIGDNQIDEFVEALSFWDGYTDSHGRTLWATTVKEQAEAIQARLVKSNYEAKMVDYIMKNNKHKTVYTLSIKKKRRLRMRPEDVSTHEYSGPVGCVTVDSGFILIRNNGQTFVTGNCSLEPHVFAHVSNSEDLRDVFRKDHDFYSTIAIAAEGLYEYSSDMSADNYLGKLNKQKRQSSKAMALGVPYGLGAYALGKTLEISTEEAQEIIDGYLDAYPDLKKWMQDSVDFVHKHGYIKSQAGRIRHLPEVKKIYAIHKDKLMDFKYRKYLENRLDSKEVLNMYRDYKNGINNARNFQIQSLSGSIVNRAAIAVVREFKKQGIDAWCCAQVHDQLIFNVPEDMAKECAILVQDKMENTTKLSLDLKAPPELSDNFRDGH